MKRKIYITDLDETLLTTDKKISPATQEIVEKLVDAGHYLVLASGRSPETLFEARQSLPISNKNLFYASFNGTMITNAATGEVIRKECMSLEDAAYFLAYCQKKGIHCQSYDNGVIIVRHNSPELEDYRQVIHMPYREVPDIAAALSGPPCKCLAISLKGPQVLDQLAFELKDWAGDRISLVKSSDKLLEAFSSKAGKGKALLYLCEYLNVDPKDTLASGDQGNDVSMIEAAGLGVAMINGAPPAREAADVITKEDNNHDGLVPILKEFFEL